MNYYGDIALGSTIDLKFTTRRFTTGAPFTLAGTPAVSAYVGNSTTEITAGITLTVDFDSRTGYNHVRVVATSGNGFATATDVSLCITAGTVDGVSVVGEEVACFSIENRSALRPTVAGRTVDVAVGGEVGIDWANIASPSTTQNLSGTSVKTATDVETDTQDIQSRLPAALVGGRMDSSVGAMAAGVITATAIAADAITDAKVAADVTIASVTGSVGSVTGSVGSVTGSVGSVTGAVGSVTGNVGGNVVGSVASVTGAVGSVTGNVGGNLVGTIGGLTVAAVADFFDTNSGTTYASAVAGSVVKEIVSNVSGGGGGLTAADVWAYATRTLTALDEDNTTLDIDNSIRSALGLASANLDTQLSGLASQITTVDTVVDAILVDTNELQTDWVNGGRLDSLLDSILSAASSATLSAASVDAIWDEAVDGAVTARQSARLWNSALGAKASGLATTSAIYRDLADTKARITATVDVDGNRTAVTRDLT